MKAKILHYTKELLLFLFVITLFSNLLSYYKSSNLNKDTLPQFQAPLLDASIYTTQNEKPTLMHFWATWCPTCKAEIDNIERLSHYYNIITIVVKSGSNEEIKSYIKERNLNFKVINDRDGFLAEKFNISAYPTTFIYDKNGDLSFSEVGYTSSLGLFLRAWWATR